MNKITNDIYFIGANDRDIDLFENQYPVENGVSYNSSVITDEKLAVMDTIDCRKSEELPEIVEEVLDGREPDYLIISHLEPDHSANIESAMNKYPSMKAVVNAKSKAFLPQFFKTDFSDRTIVVKEGDELSLGSHTLVFCMAPMVHWPEVMVEYEKSEKILFSADAFGKFGTLDADEDWLDEARRYYTNIVGKYGVQVQALLKKAAALDIEKICPLHGPVLDKDLEFYIEKYKLWSAYEPESDGVLVAYASLHGNTAAAAQKFAEILKDKGASDVKVIDLSRRGVSYAVADAFKYGKIALAASTYDAGIFAPMDDFLNHLKSKNFQNKKTALIENGTWAPMTAKLMREKCAEFKNVEVCENTVTIRTTPTDETVEQMKELAGELLA
ncbi:MAG: FprA family A-type flavoprotein [Firmicutes bacterium]|nr:FprA family A-type flavoprotein [Bacillota bacterium]